MSIESFSDYFLDQTGQDVSTLNSTTTSTQSLFSTNYTHWLDNVVLADAAVQTWLQGQLTADQWAEFQAGQWHVDLEQNSTTLAPIIDFGDGSIFHLDALFAGEDKTSFEWIQRHADQTRYYYDDASVPQTDDNDVTIGFVPTIDDNGTGTAAIGHFQASDPDDVNPVFTYNLTAASLISTDPGHSNATGALSIDSGTGNLNVDFSGDANSLHGNLSYIGSAAVTAIDATDGDSTTTNFNLFIGRDGNAAADTFDAAAHENGDGWIIDGRGGADVLTGSIHSDSIIGANQGDQITGGGGADYLRGGANGDTYIYTALTDSTHAAHDTIDGFTTIGQNDTIAFALSLGLNTFDGQLSGTTIDAGHVAWTEAGGETIVYANVGTLPETAATGADVVEIHLSGINLGLTAADFDLSHA